MGDDALDNSMYIDVGDLTVAETGSLLHRVIVDVRPMTPEERTAAGVADPRTVIVLDDGTVLFGGTYTRQGQVLGLTFQETDTGITRKQVAFAPRLG